MTFLTTWVTKIKMKGLNNSSENRDQNIDINSEKGRHPRCLCQSQTQAPGVYAVTVMLTQFLSCFCFFRSSASSHRCQPLSSLWCSNPITASTTITDTFNGICQLTSFVSALPPPNLGHHCTQLPYHHILLCSLFSLLSIFLFPPYLSPHFLSIEKQRLRPGVWERDFRFN